VWETPSTKRKKRPAAKDKELSRWGVNSASTPKNIKLGDIAGAQGSGREKKEGIPCPYEHSQQEGLLVRNGKQKGITSLLSFGT